MLMSLKLGSSVNSLGLWAGGAESGFPRTILVSETATTTTSRNTFNHLLPIPHAIVRNCFYTLHLTPSLLVLFVQSIDVCGAYDINVVSPPTRLTLLSELSRPKAPQINAQVRSCNLLSKIHKQILLVIVFVSQHII